MKSRKLAGLISKFAARIVTFLPATLTLPALAESFTLPNCPYPQVLQDDKLLLLDCDRPDPVEAPSSKSPTLPKIGDVQVFGNTVLNQLDLQRLLSPGKEQPASKQELCKLSGAMTKVYRERGYILAQVFPLVDRTTKLPYTENATFGFVAIEGCLESIDITGTQRLKPSYIKDRVAAGAQNPFNANKINDYLALIQTDPKLAKLEVLGINPGKSFGSSMLGIKVTEANSLSGFVGADSSISPFFGGVRGIGGLTYRNVTGNGDDLSVFYFRSTTGEAQGADFSYQIPINPMNGQIQVRYAPSVASVILQPNDRAFKSNVNTAELNYRQPLFRSPNKEFALSLGLSFQDQQVSLDGVNAAIIAGADSEGKTQTRVIQFSQDYTSLDDVGNWSLRSQFNLGLGGFGATNNTRPTPDGKFISWQGQAQRVQRLSPNNYAVAQLGFQLTPDPLVPNQQFTLAGDRSILGYRQSLRSSDNGIRLSLEDRAIVGRNQSGEANLQLVANVTGAKLWNNGGTTVDDSFLASVGAGVIWEPFPKLITRLDYAIPLVGIGDRGNSFQDSGFNFSIGYGF
jgi:hemolysin activation/secretion protein